MSTLTPRERTRRHLEREPVDRIPADFWAVEEIWDGLKAYFKTNSRREVLERLEVDCRTLVTGAAGVRSVLLTYVGPPLQQFDDGSFTDEWGKHRMYISHAYGRNTHFVDSPLGGFTSVDEMKDYPWPNADWWDVSDLREKIERINDKTEYHLRFDLGSIFETSWQLRGYEQFLLDLGTEDPIAEHILENITLALLGIGEKVLDAAKGMIDIVCTWDDVGTQTNLMISPQTFHQLLYPRHKRVNEMVHKFGVPILFHCDGAIFPLIEEFIDMGIDILDPLQPDARGMNMPIINERFGKRIGFHGGIDIQNTLPHGTPDQVRQEVRDRVNLFGRESVFVLASAHYIQADTPIENVLAMYEPELRYLSSPDGANV